MAPDLNPLIAARSVMSEAQWTPNTKEHINAIPAFTQFLTTSWVRNTDPYTVPLKSMNESYCVMQSQRGAPAYTLF
jgi:hypothetical protein